MAESTDLKSVKCGFESHGPHHILIYYIYIIFSKQIIGNSEVVDGYN